MWWYTDVLKNTTATIREQVFCGGGGEEYFTFLFFSPRFIYLLRILTILVPHKFLFNSTLLNPFDYMIIFQENIHKPLDNMI